MKYISTLFLLFLMFASTQLLSAPTVYSKEYRAAIRAFEELREKNSICVVNDLINCVSRGILYQINLEDFLNFGDGFIDSKTTRLNRSSYKKYEDFIVAKYNSRLKNSRSKRKIRAVKVFGFWKDVSFGPTPAYFWFDHDRLPIFSLKDLKDGEYIVNFGSIVTANAAETTASEQENDFAGEAAEQDPSMIDHQAGFSAVNSYASFPMQPPPLHPPLTAAEPAPLQILPEDENLVDLVNSIEIAPSGHSEVENNEDLPLPLQKFLMTFFPWLEAKASLRSYSTTGEVYELKVFAVDHEDPWAVLTLKLTDSEMPNTLAITFFQKPTLRGPLNFGETPCIDVDDSYPLFIKQGMLLFSRKNISLEELKSRYLKNTNLIFTNHVAKEFSIYVTIAQSCRLIEIHGDTPKFGRQFNIYISSCRLNGKETELYE